MSKRYIKEEWSDDDIDGNSLSGSPPKRQKSFNKLEISESSGSGFIGRTFNRITSSVNKLFKGLGLSSEERRMSCESVRSHSPLGMNQNQFINLEVRSDQPMLNQSILTPIPNPTSNYYLIHNPSAQQSAQLAYNVMVPVYQYNQVNATNSGNCANISPNPVVLLASAQNMDPTLKCCHCKQVSTSPVTKCRHCGQTNITGIPQNRFYNYSQNTSGVGRGRARMQMSAASMSGQTPERPVITNVRSLSREINLNNNKIASNQYLHQFCTPIDSKHLKNPEIIELDTENVDKTNQRVSQESDDFIEIMDSQQTKEVMSDSGNVVKCDMNCETNNSKTKSFERNTDSIIKTPTNDNIWEELKTTSLPEYAMFGTFKTSPKAIEISCDGIKLTNVCPNNKEIKFKYNIMIPFAEMKELLYCCDLNTKQLFIKPTLDSNNKIQESMFLGHSSANGLKFDINSIDSREHYLIIVLTEKISERFGRLLMNNFLDKKINIKCEPITGDRAKHMLQKATSRAASTAQVIRNTSPQLSTTPKQTNIFSVEKSRIMSKSSDSSDASPSQLRSSFSSRRPYQRTPTQTITIDIDDDDEEDIFDNNNGLHSEFDKVILSYPEDDNNAIHLVGTDIKCLNKGEFLNDNIVNFYLRYYFNEKLSEDMRKRTHIFDTLFFVQLTEKRPAKRKNSLGREEQYTFENRYHQKLKKWTKNLQLFKKDFLIFPIIKESHWFLSIVCYPSAVDCVNTDQSTPKIKSEDVEEVLEVLPHSFDSNKKPCIIFMDSLGNGTYKKSLSTPIREFLAQEWKELNKTELSFKTAKVMRDFSPLVPNQTNSSDCGLFVLEYVERFLECPDKLVKHLFDNKHALIEWFDSNLVKPKRQEIRELVLTKVTPQLRPTLETLIDDSKLSDSEDDMKDEIGEELMNTSVDEPKTSSPEEEVL